jgi:hypothetical protein
MLFSRREKVGDDQNKAREKIRHREHREHRGKYVSVTSVTSVVDALSRREKVGGDQTRARRVIGGPWYECVKLPHFWPGFSHCENGWAL